MTRVLAALVAIVLGLAAGWAAGRLPVAPIVRTLVGSLASMLLASVASALLWLLRPPADADVLAVSFGLGEALVTSVAVAMLAILLHALLGWAGVVAHREAIIGAACALASGLAATAGVGFVHGLK